MGGLLRLGGRKGVFKKMPDDGRKPRKPQGGADDCLPEKRADNSASYGAAADDKATNLPACYIADLRGNRLFVHALGMVLRLL